MYTYMYAYMYIANVCIYNLMMFIGVLFVNSKKCGLGIGYINTIYSNEQVWTIARYNNKTEFYNLI